MFQSCIYKRGVPSRCGLSLTKYTQHPLRHSSPEPLYLSSDAFKLIKYAGRYTGGSRSRCGHYVRAVRAAIREGYEEVWRKDAEMGVVVRRCQATVYGRMSC